ncbi:UNVERIFIED_CONTAM: hypothetical protein HDU68_000358 [Siphonaria sp. JEL0065]|nr:hypothetical protein HDU68_000358 [Siphonaria sp. JEL0065]
MAKDKKKAKDPKKTLEKKAKKAQKQEKKKDKTTTKLQTKVKQKQPKQFEEEEEDIDQILSNFQKELEAKEAVTEEHCQPPSRRSCGSFVANPINLDELILFAGEYYNGQKVALFNDFFIYNTEKNDWRKYVSPNSPGPRSSHQLVITNSGRGFLFGGEFVSPNQTTFFHYKDFWVLDLKTYSWEKLEVGKKPSPRSGHRMVLWKHYIILYGGFYDAGNETRYLDDLHVFDTVECKWITVECSEPKPTKRSGHNLIVSGDTLVLYGGYTKEVMKGKVARGIIHTDLWTIKLSFETKDWKWEKRKRGGVAPQPRCGGPMVSFKGKGFLFGGVCDVKEDDETIESVCVDEFFQLNVEQCRFYPVNLKASPTATNIKPPARFNTMMCVQRSTLYVFGGILEKDDKEITYSDLWSCDLDKLNPFKNIIQDAEAMELWAGEQSGDEDDDDEDEDDEDDEDIDDDEDGDSDEESAKQDEPDAIATVEEVPGVDPDSETEENPLEEQLGAVELDESVPRVVVVEDPLFEVNQPLASDATLRDYFARTTDYWMKKAMDDGDEEDNKPVKQKEIRRYAFIIAEEAWEEATPRLTRERKVLEENEVAAKEAAKGRDANSTEKRGRRV